MGLSVKNYSSYQDKFEKYKVGLKDFCDTKKDLVKIKDKDVTAKLAISRLLKNYRGLGQYENLKKSKISQEINEILNNQEIKKQFPFKRLLFKINKFTSDVVSSFRAARGKLKTPELITPTPPLKVDPTTPPKVDSEKKPVTIQDLADKLGLVDKPIEGTGPDDIQWVIRNSSIKEALTIMLYQNDRQHSCRLLVQDGQVHFVKVHSDASSGHSVARLPFEEVTREKLLEVAFENFGFKPNTSNADKLLEKLDHLLGPILISDDKICLIHKSKTSDSLSMVLYEKGTDKKDFYRLSLDEANEKIIITDLRSKKELGDLPFKNFSRDVLINLARKFMNVSDASKDTAPEKTISYLMLASVAVDTSDVKKYVTDRHFDLSKQVKDYPAEDIRKLLGDLKVSSLEYSRNDTLAALVKKIAIEKTPGLMVSQSHRAIGYILGRYLEEAKDQNYTLFKTLKERYDEQYEIDMNGANILLSRLSASPPQEAKARELALSIAESLLHKADAPEYREIGAFFSAGWRGEHGHHINGEIRQVGEDRYEIVIANAGSGSSHHRPTYVYDKEGNPHMDESEPAYGITTQVFEMNRAKAKAVLTEILLYNAKTQSSSAPKKGFYKLFEGTKTVENYGISTRPLQKVGNCGVRNVEELFFYVAQRQNNIEAANEFQEMLENIVQEDMDKNGERYDLVKDKLEGKLSKPQIVPWTKGPSEFVLRDLTENKDNKFPMGMSGSRSYPIGFLGVIPAGNRDAGHSRQHANLIYQDGKYYLSKHPKCAPENTVEYARKGTKINVKAGEKVELQKGDRILLNGDAFLEVA